MTESTLAFTGFTEAALDFYDDLELDNTKSFWEAHKDVYLAAVKAPMTALVTALEPEFGTAKVFRPYRDVRFAKDKTPYKTNQGAFVGAGPACGWYVEIAARGVRTGAGFYDASTSDLSRIRRSIANELTGTRLQRILTKLEKSGFTIGGDRLKTAPRGYDADHPRIELLRHRSLTVGKDYGFEPIIHTHELVEAVRADWKAARPVVDWVTDRLGD
jgi:uncharacterized protein (TIGR02453 family)